MSARGIVGTVRAALLSVVLGGLAGEARAAAPELFYFYSGNALLALCDSAGQFDRGICLGFVAGVADALSTVSEKDGSIAGWRACRPENVTLGQARDVVLKHLRAYPERRHLTASSLAARALAEAWPCR